MTYLEQSLSANEKIHKIFKLHWLIWVQVVLLVIASPFSFGLLHIGFSIAISASVFVILMGIALFMGLSIRCTEQGVTNKRVVLKKGIIARKTEEVKITSIETIEIRQSIWGRILGYGDVKITGRGDSLMVYKGIDNPMDVKRSIESIHNPID